MPTEPNPLRIKAPPWDTVYDSPVTNVLQPLRRAHRPETVLNVGAVVALSPRLRARIRVPIPDSPLHIARALTPRPRHARPGAPPDAPAGP